MFRGIRISDLKLQNTFRGVANFRAEAAERAPRLNFRAYRVVLKTGCFQGEECSKMLELY